MAKTKKEKAFELFDEGFSVSSPELKGLKLSNATRHNYHYQWLHRDMRPAEDQTHGRKAKEDFKKTRAKELEMSSIPVIDETKIKQAEPKPPPEKKEEDWLEKGVEQYYGPNERPKNPDAPDPLFTNREEGLAPEEEAKTEESELDVPHSPLKPKKKLPELLSQISSEGIPMKVFLSIKTLNLYEIARSLAKANGNGDGQDVELSLGDFLDLAAEDYFIGRGYDLGLIQLEEEKEEVSSG